MAQTRRAQGSEPRKRARKPGNLANTRGAPEPAGRKRYRKPGSVGQLRGMVWEALLAASAMIEAPGASEDRQLKAMHAMAQLSGAYMKAIEVSDLAKDVAMLKEAAQQHRG